MNHRRIRWIALASLSTFLLLAAMGWYFLERNHYEPSQLLAVVEQIEHADVDPITDQISFEILASNLAFLGRDDDVRSMDVHPQYEFPQSQIDVNQLELKVVPWKDGIQKIADNHRIVMIMEHHFFSKHREFIGATLPAFKNTGFTHFAAEAISRIDSSLVERGYPNKYSGLYTTDPQFGNVLRSAIELDFKVLGYDYSMTKHEEREEYAATRLAKLFEEDSDTKLLVHAGHSHVLKYETQNNQRWLASLLWEKTGIEPFTIWQWSTNHDAHDYEKLVNVLKTRGVSFDEPVLLMPPPDLECGLQNPPYRLARVDAIVLHPPDQSFAPAHRTVLFPDAMQQLAGRWTDTKWPVVVSVYKKGEPINAIPLDQVMLRQGETDFVLWIPDAIEYEIRVFNSDGLLDSSVVSREDFISIGR